MRAWYPREYRAYRFNSGNELKEVVAQQAKLLFSEIDLKDERTELVFSTNCPVRKSACLSQEEEGRCQFISSLQPLTTFPSLLTSMFRVASAFFIPFLCATFLSSFKPSSGLLVTISHREDSTCHLMKEEQTGIVNPSLLICYLIIDNMFYVFHLLSTTSTRHSCCARLILGKYESDNSILG